MASKGFSLVNTKANPCRSKTGVTTGVLLSDMFEKLASSDVSDRVIVFAWFCRVAHYFFCDTKSPLSQGCGPISFFKVFSGDSGEWVFFFLVFLNAYSYKE